jgi:PKHD-type hydroxylase
MKDVWPLRVDNIYPYAYINNFLSKEECENIIKIGKNKGLKEAKVGVGGPGLLNKKIRKSSTNWLYPSDGLFDFFKKFTDATISLNSQFYNFHIFSFSEGLQFTHYKAPGEHYGKHIDRGLHGGIRKLSISIQLSDPNSYKGGDLHLYDGDAPTKTPREQGTLIMFPSFVLHEVKPVTKGERFSLVAWVTGDPFK